MSEDDRTLVMSVLRSKQAETHHHAGQLLHNNRAQLVVSPFTIGACIVLMLLVSAGMGLGRRVTSLEGELCRKSGCVVWGWD